MCSTKNCSCSSNRARVRSLITAASRRALAIDSFPSATAVSVAGMVRRRRANRVSCNESPRLTSARARSQQANE